MKLSLSFLLIAALSFNVVAQKKMNLPPKTVAVERVSIAKKDLERLQQMEDSLRYLSNVFVYDTSLQQRSLANDSFIRKLVRALRTEYSFYYPFDSVTTVSKIYPPDSSFRIFTWQLAQPKGNYRYFGMIQMKSQQLKMFPLYDMSDTMSYMSQQVTTPNNWYGCLYYNIIQKEVDKKPVYTLFGYEAPDLITRRKVVDILSFDHNGKPKFGAPLFYFKYEDTTKLKRTDTLTRFFLEYKFSARTILNYDKELEMIVFDHVAPPTEKAKGATFIYVPDGTYEGFVWKNNRWNWVEKVFTFAINENDNPPIPVPLFGDPKKQPTLPGEDKPK